MKTDNYRTIHTKLYSKIAAEILESVNGQLSDGYWENSPRMESYWLFSDIAIEPDGEVILKISTATVNWKWHKNRPVYNKFGNMTDDQILGWYADKVKFIMNVELKDEHVKSGWKRDNTEFETSYLSYHENITVADVYFVYDFLKDRQIAGRYSEDAINRIVSRPKEKAQVEAELTKRAKLQKLDDQLTADRTELEAWKKAEIAKIEAEYTAKYTKMLEVYKTNRACIEAIKAA